MVESLPSEMGWGFVKGRIIHAIADTPDDPDDKPEARAATGSVVFSPKETLRRTVEHFSAFAVQGPETVRLATEQDIAIVQARIDNYEGEGAPSGPDYEIPELGELVDSSSRPGIWMVEGTYSVMFNIASGKIPSFEIDVTRDYTRENPLLLSRVGGVTPGPGDSILVLKVPSGGAEGEVLTSDGSDKLSWREPLSVDVQAVKDEINDAASGHLNDAEAAANRAEAARDAAVDVSLGMAPAIQQTRIDNFVTRNLVTSPDELPERVELIRADAGNETRQNLAGMTITVEQDSPWGAGVPAWRLERTEPGTTHRLNVTFGTGPADPEHCSALGVELWVDDPSKIVDVQLTVVGGPGTWVRAISHSNTSHSTGGGIPLTRGRNIIRFESRSSATENLTGITDCRVWFTATEATTMWVRRTWAETPPVGMHAFIIDWGSKLGYEAWKSDLLPHGIPCTVALRVGRLGEGAAPNHHMTVDDVKELISLGGSISLHSFEGSSMDGMSPEQIRADMIRSVAELQRLGIYTSGALHRAAWTRNLAPNASAVNDLLLTARTYEDRQGTTPWPPVQPRNYAATRIASPATVDALFASIERDRTLWAGYIHGVTPDGDANHISQADWDYYCGEFVSRVQSGIVRAVTVEKLASESRLLHLPEFGQI